MALLINDEYVDDEPFLAKFRELGGLSIDPKQPAARQEAEALSRLAEEHVIGFILLRQLAVQSGITVTTTEVEKRREELWGTSSASTCGAGVWKAIGEQMLVDRYSSWITRHEQRPSRAEVEGYYRIHREEFHVPEQVRVMQVVCNVYLAEDEEQAQTAIQKAEQEIQGGQPFRQVAERYSDCGGKVDLGWIARGEMVTPFEDVAFALEKGQQSSIFRTVFGFHLIQILDRRAGGYETFQQMHATLAKQLLQMRRDRKIKSEVEKAIRNATIRPVPTAVSRGAS